MSRLVRVHLTEPQARALFLAAVRGQSEMTEGDMNFDGKQEATLGRAITRLVRAYGIDHHGHVITGRPRKRSTQQEEKHHEQQ